jgi:hypothetical protein
MKLYKDNHTRSQTSEQLQTAVDSGLIEERATGEDPVKW